MGADSARVIFEAGRAAVGVIALALLACATLAQAPAPEPGRKDVMSTRAHQYIAAFERGEYFNPPATGLMVNGQPDLEALEILGKELAAAGPSVRENIVALLVDLGRQADPLTSRGADVIRHRRILELLAGPGLAKPDLGREAAMDALRKLVTFQDLARFHESLSKVLEHTPTEEGFLLVAKSKPLSAKLVVSQLAASAAWKAVEDAQIAAAALGAASAEEKFLARADAAEAASDGKALSASLGSLALIGTPRSLNALAGRLRTPLTVKVPGAYERSVRLSVLEGLLYNFPDHPELYPNNIITDADYQAAERFCEQRLGLVYYSPRPPFLTYRGYPIPLAR
jgi:hypothetical protein